MTEDQNSIGGNDPAGASRQERLRDYQLASLMLSDAFESNLNVVNANLMGLAERVGTLLTGALAAAQTLEDAQSYAAGMGEYLRITKQIDRFSQLSLRLRSERRRAEGEERRS